MSTSWSKGAAKGALAAILLVAVTDVYAPGDKIVTE